MPKAERRQAVPLLASRRGEKDDTRYKKTFAPAHYSQFVFRNNTVCSGKRRGFPVIYRQSDEARQTKPPIISFPLISPLSGDRPARGRFSLPAANRMVKAERQSAVPLFRLSKKASQSLRPQAQIKFQAFLPAACTSAKILLGSQTCERKRVRCGEPQPFQTRAQRSWSRLRACQKSFFDTLKSGTAISRSAFTYSVTASIAAAYHAPPFGQTNASS